MAMASGLRSHTEHCRPGDLLVVVRESPLPSALPPGVPWSAAARRAQATAPRPQC